MPFGHLGFKKRSCMVVYIADLKYKKITRHVHKNVSFTSIRRTLALCASCIGSMRPLQLSAPGTFNNTKKGKNKKTKNKRNYLK
jgi:hypothetical protein